MKFDFPDKDAIVFSKDNEDEKSNDKCKIYFGRVVNLSRNGIRALTVSPEGKKFFIAIKLRFDCTNNVSKYEVCVNGL